MTGSATFMLIDTGLQDRGKLPSADAASADGQLGSGMRGASIQRMKQGKRVFIDQGMAKWEFLDDRDLGGGGYC